MARLVSVEGSAGAPLLRFPHPYNATVDLLDRHLAEGRGDKVAYKGDRDSVTYAELALRVNRAGNALRDAGVEMEQRVLLLMLDSIEFVAVFLGAMRIGAVPVPVNTLLAPKDYAHFLRDSRAAALVVSDALLPKIRDALEGPLRPRTVLVATTVVGGDDDGHPRLDQTMEQASPELSPAETSANDTAFWLYSSGSTGVPKGTVHLHRNLLTTAVLYAEGVVGVDESDVIFSAAKLFFAYGLGNSLTFPLAAGATTILRAGRPTASSVLELLRQERPTLFCGVPTLFAALLAEPGADVEPLALRASISAGEALPRHVGERWRPRFGSDILDGLGSTEMLHIFLSNRPGAVRYGTSGTPVPGYDLRLTGDDGEPMPAAPAPAEGALWVRGPSAASHYWNDRERTLLTFHGPWTRTGDRYARDADCYYTYAGRTDDMLKVGGIWVSPFEVESALAAHPRVREAAVVGHADADDLIKPKAFVVLEQHAHPSLELAEELKAFVKTTLAPYKYPRWIEFVDELPKTATGKVQRFKLRG